MVVRLAETYRDRGSRAGLEPDDLTQEGILALVRAANAYDPLFRTTFGTYAYRWACRAMDAACAVHPVPTDPNLDRLPERPADDAPETELDETRARTMTRTQTLESAAREYVWLWELRRGVSTRAIAEREGVSLRVVRYRIARARAAEKPDPADTPRKPRPPTLVPLFPVLAYSTTSECPHHGPIRSGSVLCCMVCHRSGQDDHPALQRDPRTDPQPEQIPAAPPRHKRETRKQRRLRLFGATV